MEQNRSDVIVVLAAPIIDASKLEVAELVKKCCQICVHYNRNLCYQMFLHYDKKLYSLLWMSHSVI